MKIALVLLSVLIATSYAVTLKANSRAVLKALSQNFDDKPSFKGVFKSLLELTAGDEYQEVYETMQSVRAEIQDALSSAQQKLADENQAYNDQITSYEDAVTDLDKQESDVEEQISDASDQRDKLQNLVEQATNAISTATSIRDQEKQRREQQEEANEEKVKDLGEAIGECDELVSVLKQVSSEDLSSSQQLNSASLLQVKKKRVQNGLESIDKKLQNINTASPFASFIHSLVKIAHSGVNEDQIDQITTVVLQLKVSLQNEQEQTQEDDQKDEDNSNNIVASQDSAIAAQNTLLGNSQTGLAQVIGLIETDNTKLDNLKDNIDNLTGLINNLNDAHQAKVTAFNDLIDRLTNDIAAVDQALSFLNSQMS